MELRNTDDDSHKRRRRRTCWRLVCRVIASALARLLVHGLAEDQDDEGGPGEP